MVVHCTAYICVQSESVLVGHIYVGVGDFPKNIVQQVEAYVVGGVP